MTLDPDFSWDSIAPEDDVIPTVGIDFSYTIPANHRGRLIYFAPELTTSAQVAARGVMFSITRGTRTLFRYPATTNYAVQNESRVNTYCHGVGLVASDAVDQVTRHSALPRSLELNAGDVIKTTTTNIQTGDQWYVMWVYKEVSDA